jgi:copper chaperone
METAIFTVRGMTCSHCVNAVTEELLTIMGVTDVAIDLVEGGDSTISVTSTDPLNVNQVEAAVDEAGYVLVR